jgi:hypothetical protein
MIDIVNISHLINLDEFTNFCENIPKIKNLKSDLSPNAETFNKTKVYYNEHNSQNYLIFDDEPEAKHLPWNKFDTIFEEKNLSFCFINQPPGQFTSPHYDSFIGYCKFKNIPESMASKIKRYVIFLKDWKFGQVFCFENQTISNWKKGDMIAWPYMQIHSTSNAGYENRLVLTITGIKND